MQSSECSFRFLSKKINEANNKKSIAKLDFDEMQYLFFISELKLHLRKAKVAF